MPERYLTHCLYFHWDRPCQWHKLDGRSCEACDRHTPVGARILIVKLAALGDVLRTTCLLEPLHQAYQNPFIVWVTLPEATSLLCDNPLINAVWTTDALGLLRLQSSSFDLVLSPDSDQDSAMLASLPKGLERRGFFWDQALDLMVIRGESGRLFALSHDDRLKKENRKTYQDLISEVCGLESNGAPGRIIFQPGPEDLSVAQQLLGVGPQGDPRSTLHIAFVTGAGGRWEKKTWLPQYYVRLAQRLLEEEPQARIFLLGGKDENLVNREIMAAAASGGRLTQIDTAASMRLFGSVFNFMDLVVTGDTLGLHLALAARKRVICLVGPTSGPELELYGLGKTIASPIDCACCYRTSCTVKPSCMELIPPESVFDEARRQLEKARSLRDSPKETISP